ncbi:DUF2513 domain-containing protein [Mesorhizobium sp.]|uniref:DUF2513 domain-containing protein n=1 Tax=Mesorhizobium sp. TaxID=1871066 RepID=UPI000FE5FE6E|nr:DUF2513 domain-containing protein [Mesorhizobium sp.]RWO87966.1 MAG: DUF2513 domain-containing protein [Mesorhizobium sp.]
MKRDMELVRQIMLWVQEKPDLNPALVAIEGHEFGEINRHVEILSEAGFLDVMRRKMGSGPDQFFVRDLTWEGHEFIATTQNKTVWSKMKSTYGTELPKMPLDIVKGIATKLFTDILMAQIAQP